MAKIKTKNIFLIILAWLAASGLISFLGYPAALFGYVDGEYYYAKNSESLQLDSVWMHTVLEESHWGIAAIPVFRYEHGGRPYSAGVQVVDYENVRNLEYLTITDLSVSSGSQTQHLIDSSNPLTCPFETYIPKVKHVLAKCTINLEDWADGANDEPIHLSASIELTNKDTRIAQELHKTYHRSDWRGFWRFWDIFYA
ncbi:MAG: hypothetical protein KC897_06670 [Candidatus Omnitrophica bacterium]|nr:hypothetical protein [Candidatus Omnitrophota bacterium]MCB9722290.1 hypothetical protein [Candidatus Omnitrophota bacterium]